MVDAPIFPLTARAYDTLIAAGAFGDGDHVELLDGVMYAMTPQGFPHARRVTAIRDVLLLRFVGRAAIATEQPIDCDHVSVPEPDVAVFPRDVYYGRDESRPSAHETWLIIEVSRTSQAYDLKKVAVYARGGAPLVWLLDLPGEALRVFDQLDDGGYGRERHFGPDDAVELPEGGGSVAVSALLSGVV